MNNTDEREISNLIDDVIKKAREAGMREERNRIMRRILKADLPVGIWPLIKNIINPE